MLIHIMRTSAWCRVTGWGQFTTSRQVRYLNCGQCTETDQSIKASKNLTNCSGKDSAAIEQVDLNVEQGILIIKGGSLSGVLIPVPLEDGEYVIQCSLP